MGAITTLVEGAAKTKRQLATWFFRNASAKHGVPWEDDGGEASASIKVEHVHKHEGLEALEADATSPPAAPQPPPSGPSASQEKPVVRETKKSETLRKLLPWLLAAGLAGGGGLAGWGITKAVQGGPETIVVDRTNYEGSLLQYAEDHGWHLPEGKK